MKRHQARNFLYLIDHDEALGRLGRNAIAEAFWEGEIAALLLWIQQVDPDRVLEGLAATWTSQSHGVRKGWIGEKRWSARRASAFREEMIQRIRAAAHEDERQENEQKEKSPLGIAPALGRLLGDLGQAERDQDVHVKPVARERRNEHRKRAKCGNDAGREPGRNQESTDELGER